MKKLESLFNMPSSDESEPDITAEEAIEHVREQKELLEAATTAVSKIDVALPTVRDLEASDAEMDDLAKLAQDTFNDLISLSMNVEPRYSGPIIQSASTLLGHAVTAKQAKINKKLHMVELQLKKARQDLMERAQTFKETSQAAKTSTGEEDEVEGEGVVIDRSSLLRQILEQAGNTKTDK